MEHTKTCCTYVPFKKLDDHETIGDTLFLSDSIFFGIDLSAIEKAAGGTIKAVKTYSSKEDCRSWFPSKNVHDVLQEQLHVKKYDTVILAAPSLDITNQKVEENIKQFNRDETIASCDAMVQAADFAICSGRSKKVILLHHAPRYDTEYNDPNGIRSALAKFSNKMTQCRRNLSSFSEHILVGTHRGLESEGNLRWRLFANDGTTSNVKKGKYDGYHFYSAAGRHALTNSVMSIIEHQMKTEKPMTEPEWKDARNGRGFKGRQTSDV